MSYTVEEYLYTLGQSAEPSTVRQYRITFESFAEFLGVPVDEIHNHLSSASLIKYAGSLKGYSPQTVRNRIALLRAYFRENDIKFRNVEMKALNSRKRSEPEDKPLELETLQKMMDIGDARSRAFITVMVSTGMRAGECSQLRLSDVKDDTITIPGSIAKNKHGGKVYLTAEAREYLDIWLLNRDEFIRLARIHADVFYRHGIKQEPEPHDEDRLFASGYTGLNAMFRRLYQKVDGEKGKYRGKITPHSMRKYFRTALSAGGLNVDIVEGLMRHTGYLSTYIRMADEEIRRQFHEHEDALYITRPDRRHSENVLAVQADKIAHLENRIAAQDKILERLKSDKEAKGESSPENNL